jgi:hypothetical protein
MELTAGTFSTGMGGMASFIAGSSSSGAGGSLNLESGDRVNYWWSIAMKGGRGSNSLEDIYTTINRRLLGGRRNI